MLGFISYARADLAMLNRMMPQLRSIERQTGKTFWSDEQINAGTEFPAKIKAAIDQSHLFLLLVSADFLASDFIRDHEWPWIQARRQQDPTKIAVARVVVHPCDHDLIEDTRQAIPKHPTDGRLRAISKWGNRKDAFNHVRQAIMHTMKEFDMIPADTPVR